MEYKTQTIQNETISLCNETGQHCETAKPAENKSVIDDSDHCNTGSFFLINIVKRAFQPFP